jgi:hypothetical protein
MFYMHVNMHDNPFLWLWNKIKIKYKRRYSFPKIPFLKLGSFFSYVTKRGCKLSYILPFSCEIKMISDREQRISVRTIILQNFQKNNY